MKEEIRCAVCGGTRFVTLPGTMDGDLFCEACERAAEEDWQAIVADVAQVPENSLEAWARIIARSTEQN